MNFPTGNLQNNSASVNCGCKINLRLKITGKRPDKLHNLSSCFLFLDHPGDQLDFSVTERSGIEFSCPGHPALEGADNLVYRAAELFAARAGITPAWRIRLQKNVPLAAGLGGGSAGAGGMLALLNSFYPCFSAEELNSLAFSLGADVPFFLNRRSAWVTGAGEVFETLENLPPLPEILIVNPGFPVSAKWAYTHMDRGLVSPDDPALQELFTAGKVVDWQEFCRNDLAPALFEKFPLLEMMRKALFELGALAVQVSGSGSSLFALFDSGAAECAVKLRSEFAAMENIRIFTGGEEF